MKIIFLCGCLEPGKDGVGDYVRRLAAEFTLIEHAVAIVSLNDQHIKQVTNATQRCEGVEIKSLRLPASLEKDKRQEIVNEFIQTVDPDLISLHFVLYSFDPRGLPFGLAKFLGNLGKQCRWHLMFHEIWLGERRNDVLKHKMIGTIQKRIVRRTLQNLKPFDVFTSNHFYQKCLQTLGINVKVVPIYNSLPIGNDGGSSLFKLLPPEVAASREDFYIGTFFGRVDLDKLADNLENLSRRVGEKNKKLIVVHIGQNGSIQPFFEKLNIKNLQAVCFGPQDGQDIADFFKVADIGLSTYPKLFFETSSSIASMLNNNLPVVLLQDNAMPDTRQINFVEDLDEIEDILAFARQKKNFGEQFSIRSAITDYEASFLQVGEMAALK